MWSTYQTSAARRASSWHHRARSKSRLPRAKTWLLGSRQCCRAGSTLAWIPPRCRVDDRDTRHCTVRRRPRTTLTNNGTKESVVALKSRLQHLLRVSSLHTGLVEVANKRIHSNLKNQGQRDGDQTVTHVAHTRTDGRQHGALSSGTGRLHQHSGQCLPPLPQPAAAHPIKRAQITSVCALKRTI